MHIYMKYLKFSVPFLLCPSVVMLSGCAQMFPAAVREVEQGVYEISALSNGFGSYSSLVAKVDRKAKKVCGDRPFYFVDRGDLASKESVTYIDGVKQSSNYLEFKRTVVCQLNEDKNHL